jgi:hypothetical protein
VIGTESGHEADLWADPMRSVFAGGHLFADWVRAAREDWA